VQPDANAGQVGCFNVRLLKQQRERHRRARSVERQKAAVAGPIDDAAVALRGDPTNDGAMLLDQIADRMIPALALQCDGRPEASRRLNPSSG
jgi:hypothetical protein